MRFLLLVASMLPLQAELAENLSVKGFLGRGGPHGR